MNNKELLLTRPYWLLPILSSKTPAESPVNDPQYACQYCGRMQRHDQMTYDAMGRPFCDVGHRTACEILEASEL
jgi:hypothetical protein